LDSDEVAAVVIEPIIQGAAGMQVWPGGTLRRLREWCDEVGALLIADEVMTGFGRTGRMFACEHEDVQPDLYVFAKGLTGGYLPLALTLISHKVFEPFEDRNPDSTLFYGHSYTGNALGCAAALASLEIFRLENTIEALTPKIEVLYCGLRAMAQASGVEETRSCVMIGAIDLAGGGRCAAEVCQVARERGLLTRHIRSTVTLMPPLIVSISQLAKALDILNEAVQIVVSRTSNRQGSLE
jgi:adenosylmethionine-8-amino-7-oxononanoate aminotransferase